MFTVNEILNMAIQIEKNGEDVYRRAIEKISDPALVSLLKWMADEEVKHAEWFAELKQEFEMHSKDLLVREISREFLNDLLGEQNFSLKDRDFSQVGQVNDLIDIFIEFEKDTILFYELLQPFIRDEDTLLQLQKIIAEERRHIELLQEFIESKELE